ncbi:MAG: hypothetical protein ACLT98_08535 [Eggerthellaceae bacterium]
MVLTKADKLSRQQQMKQKAPEEATTGGRHAARGARREGHRHRRTALAHQEQRAVGAATACTRKKTAPKGRFLSLEESGATGER